MENEEPLEDLKPSTGFTKSHTIGRYGILPLLPLNE